MEAGGLERRIRAFRLPDNNACREMDAVTELELHRDGDSPVRARVFTEDGYQARSSPIFAFRGI